MKALTYIEHDKFALIDKQKPTLQNPQDAIVRVTMSSICTSDLHIKHGSVPRAVPGITVGHEMVGIVEQIGDEVMSVCPGDRVTVNVETFCGGCFFCKHGYVNNCTDPNGGWALGCRIDGGQAEYVRVPFADQGLNRIPDSDGRTGTLCRGYSGYRLLGCPHLRDPAGGYRSDHRRGAYRDLYVAVRDASESESYHCLRKRGGKTSVSSEALPEGAGLYTGRM